MRLGASKVSRIQHREDESVEETTEDQVVYGRPRWLKAIRLLRYLRFLKREQETLEGKEKGPECHLEDASNIK